MMSRRVGFVLTIASILALGIGASLVTARAAAVWLDLTTPQSIAGHLTIHTASAAPYWVDIAPGDEIYWPVTAALEDSASSHLELEFTASGTLAQVDGMTIEVHRCASAFAPGATPADAPSCPTAPALVQAEAPLTAVASNFGSGRFPLGILYAGAPQHLLLTLRLPATADPLSVAAGDVNVGLGLHATGIADPPSNPQLPPSTSPPSLSSTGSDAYALGLLAIGSLGLALGTVMLRRARSAEATGAGIGGCGKTEVDE